MTLYMQIINIQVLNVAKTFLLQLYILQPVHGIRAQFIPHKV
jgi:hypothetical protein